MVAVGVGIGEAKPSFVILYPIFLWYGILYAICQKLDCLDKNLLVSLCGDKARDGPISKCTLRLGRQGGYLQIRSPKLNSEHTAPKLQSIASG